MFHLKHNSIISDNIYATGFELAMTVDLCMAYAHARVDDLDFDTRSQCIGRCKSPALNYLDNYESILSIKLAAKVGR